MFWPSGPIDYGFNHLHAFSYLRGRIASGHKHLVVGLDIFHREIGKLHAANRSLTMARV